jgi:hypothetical protein
MFRREITPLSESMTKAISESIDRLESADNNDQLSESIMSDVWGAMKSALKSGNTPSSEEIKSKVAKLDKSTLQKIVSKASPKSARRVLSPTAYTTWSAAKDRLDSMMEEVEQIDEIIGVAAGAAARKKKKLEALRKAQQAKKTNEEVELDEARRRKSAPMQSKPTGFRTYDKVTVDGKTGFVRKVNDETETAQVDFGKGETKSVAFEDMKLVKTAGGVKAESVDLDEKYAKATSKSDDGKGMDPVGKEDGDIDNDGDSDSSDKYLHARRKAIGKAMKKRKMAEGIEQIDEISREKMQTYKRKASLDFVKNDRPNPDMLKRAAKRRRGLDMVNKKMRREEVELDELSDKMLDRYRQKAFKDQPAGDDGSDKYRKRKFGRDLAFAKQTGRARVNATEEFELEEAKYPNKEDSDERLQRAATGKFKPYETNITDHNMLKKGDIIRSNDSMYAIFLGQDGDMLRVKTASGTIMKISKSNKIDWYG